MLPFANVKEGNGLSIKLPVGGQERRNNICHIVPEYELC